MDQKTDVRDPDEKVVEIEMERLRAFPNHIIILKTAVLWQIVRQLWKLKMI